MTATFWNAAVFCRVWHAMEERRKILHGVERSGLLLAGLQRRISRLIGRNYASSYLVYHCRFPCGLCRESAYAYAFVDHVDSGARHCRLEYWRSCNPSLLSAERWRPISSRRHNRFNSRSDFSPLSLAQVQTANTTRVKLDQRILRLLTLLRRQRDNACARRNPRDQSVVVSAILSGFPLELQKRCAEDSARYSPSMSKN